MSDAPEPAEPETLASIIREPDRAARLERLRKLLAVAGPFLRPIIEALIERLLGEMGQDAPPQP